MSKSLTACTSLLLAMGALPLHGKFLAFGSVPLTRLLPYAEAEVKKNPNDPQAHYLLGRLYSLKFSLQTSTGAWMQDGRIPKINTAISELKARPVVTPLTQEDIQAAMNSLTEYNRALDLDAKSALYHFSLAWMDQQCARFATQLTIKTKAQWLGTALNEYRTSYHLSLPHDRNSESRLGPYLTEQAGTAIIELLKPLPGSDQQIAAIQTVIRELQTHARAITPLIFSTNPTAQLPDLLSNRIVTFDLDGFGDNRQWPWVAPTTCILVWDPEQSGHIASGQQLFGSVTWWMFWTSGFQPLMALDDNRDGVISGEELKGISVWRDANSNGIADPGEVVTASKFRMTQIKITLDGAQIQMQGGQRLSIFDWTPTSKSQPLHKPQNSASVR